MSSTPPRDPAQPGPVESVSTELAVTVTAALEGESVVASLGKADADAFDSRYHMGEPLGRGGMGEVRALDDARVGRRVAMKTLRAKAATSEEAQARFVRELRIQGQLEHPAVLPVYDVGLDPSGQPYFTMKALEGETLSQILAGLRDGDTKFTERFSRRKLLDELRDVCLAVDFAHNRGVIHRDLKPQNIMLGGFGEVYVLDWGLAKVMGDPDGSFPDSQPSRPSHTPSVDVPDSGRTEAGEVLGTPGYMAPEQLYGDELDRRADVYALGAILFEVLAGEPLHRRDGDILRSTVEGCDARASARAPDGDVPPELEAVCVAATLTDREARTQTAREVADALDRYLDGDRDVERRKQLADEHARVGIDAAESVPDDHADAEGARRTAVRELGRALALDPDHEGALAALSRLMLEPPDQVPAEVERELDAHRQQRRQTEAGGAVFAFLLSLAFVPVLMWIGIEDLGMVAVIAAIPFALVGINAYAAFVRPATWPMYVQSILLSVLVLVGSRVFSPLLFAPVVATTVVAFASINGYTRLLAVTAGAMLLCLLAPVIGELTGLVSPTLRFTGDSMILESSILRYPKVPWLVGLTLFHIVTMLVAPLLIARIAERTRDYERKIQLHAWHLRQLVPRSNRSLL